MLRPHPASQSLEQSVQSPHSVAVAAPVPSKSDSKKRELCAGPSVLWRAANHCAYATVARPSLSRAARPAAGSSPSVAHEGTGNVGLSPVHIPAAVQHRLAISSHLINREVGHTAMSGAHWAPWDRATFSRRAPPRTAQPRNLTIRSTGPPPAAGELKRSAP